jgi:outer membrane lipoprotein-sorting protein
VNFPDEVMPEPTLQPTNVQIQAGDDGTATLAYTLKTEIRHPGLQVRLTFDPKTFLLKKRTLTLQHPQAVITIVEIYDLIQIDLDLPESTFKF